MTSPVEQIDVECPGCGKTYRDWHRPSFNFNLGVTYYDEYLDRATSATCPHCGLKVKIETLFVRGGTFTWGTLGERKEEQ
jgi:endogenous inhibitor of DNA gyrase (YacG/DUF329 family)